MDLIEMRKNEWGSGPDLVESVSSSALPFSDRVADSASLFLIRKEETPETHQHCSHSLLRQSRVKHSLLPSVQPKKRRGGRGWPLHLIKSSKQYPTTIFWMDWGLTPQYPGSWANWPSPWPKSLLKQSLSQSLSPNSPHSHWTTSLSPSRGGTPISNLYFYNYTVIKLEFQSLINPYVSLGLFQKGAAMTMKDLDPTPSSSDHPTLNQFHTTTKTARESSST